jgi:hypothetical protein
MNKILPNSYYKSPNNYKGRMIAIWKHRGVIYHDLDELFEVYINTNVCSHCSKEFINSRNRCLDHCHETGLFRKIVCQGCNVRDSYLKYPPHFTHQDKKKQNDKEYNEKNRDKRNQKGNCFFCAKYLMIRSLKRHYLEGRCIIKPIT